MRADARRNAPSSRRRRAVVLVLLLPLVAFADGIQLTAPHDGGGDTLWCGGYAEARKASKGDDGEPRLFVSDVQSDHTDTFPNGFVVIGIGDKDVRLRAPAGVHLIVGGTFASVDEPRTLLRVTPIALDYLKDMAGEEESILDVLADFEVVRGARRLRFRGSVNCSVYDFDSFAEAVCPSAASGTAQPLACRAMRASLSRGAPVATPSTN